MKFRRILVVYNYFIATRIGHHDALYVQTGYAFQSKSEMRILISS